MSKVACACVFSFQFLDVCHPLPLYLRGYFLHSSWENHASESHCASSSDGTGSLLVFPLSESCGRVRANMRLTRKATDLEQV